ncbi:unnamed protein product [Ilex paraguariensis]|uniref:Protein kinase domain-containing protein n=1 Tax=Ilex paraguariensis TaxID=185542 RepID=A0ABC8U1W9_9AQUA
MENNLFTGTIPSNLGKLQRLQQLLLYGNRLSGQIPPSLGNLSQMYSLFLAINRLEGNIPSSIGNCQNLQMLELSQNRLTGIIPKDVMSFSSLSKHLNLSQNSLNGSLPQEVGKLRNINTLDISNNKLSGEIPGTIGDCSSLEYLNMQGNLFEGTIPLTLASLKGIQHLDLSGNNLSGEIPKDLGSLRFLQYLNLSFNELEGEVPTKGVFKNASAISVVGNTKLCGGILELNLPPCPTNVKKHGRPKAFKIGIIVGSVVLFSMLMMSFGALCFWRKERTSDSFSTSSRVDGLLRISYYDLYQATAGFSSGNLIGSGSFGSVYKGSLQQGKERLVAVKVLELEKSGASKSFAAECRALRNIRHRNLVKILSYCSSIDSKGNEFKALVYEFMENGSLDSWLHPEIVEVNTLRTLNLLQRLNIAIDVSSALHYLHNHCETPVIHCDLKPSNILLDNDLTAHVGDFGLARLHSGKTNDILQQQNSSIGVKGSIGYAAPEYGMGGDTSTHGDVYSYGVLLLEMFTGRRPTDDMFKDDLNLHNYVKRALPKQVLQIVDPVLLAKGEIERDEESIAAPGKEEEDDDDNDNHNEIEQQKDNKNFISCRRGSNKMVKGIISALQIGLACTAESPTGRMNMSKVSRELQLIRSVFLG